MIATQTMTMNKKIWAFKDAQARRVPRVVGASIAASEEGICSAMQVLACEFFV